MRVKNDERPPAVDCAERTSHVLTTKRRKQHKTNSVVSLLRLLSLFAASPFSSHGPNLCRYSAELMKALTISA